MGKTKLGIILATVLAVTAACSGGGGSAGGGSSKSNDLVISGKLGNTNIVSKPQAMGKVSKGVGTFGTYDDLKFYVTIVTDPPQIKSVDLGSDGSFSLTFPGASGSVIMAFFKSKSTGLAQHVSFVDSSKKSMNSSAASEMDSYALKGNVSFGTLNLVDGKATIDVVTVIPDANKSEAAPTMVGFDFSGTWTAGAYTLPAALVAEGFVTAEDASGSGPFACGEEPCMAIGTPLTLVKISGKEFTPGSGCTDNSCSPTANGVVGTANKNGLSIWEGPVSGAGSALQACGYKTGFTADSARFGAGIHISSVSVGSQPLAMNDFTFDSLGGVEPWMDPNAVSKFDIYDCSPQSHVAGGNTYNLYVCKITVDDNGAGGTTVYQASEQTNDGCLEDGTGKPVRMTDWSVQPDGNMCTDADVAGFNGFKHHECHYTNKDPDGSGPATATSFTCRYGNGVFTSSALSTPATAVVWGASNGPDKVLAQNQNCSTLDLNGSAQEKLAAYQCYAQNYDRPDSGCVRDYRFNWGATTAEQFVMDDSRGRPQANFLTDLLTYSADGNTFFVNNKEKEVVGIRAAQNSVEFCEIERSTKIIGKKVSANQQLLSVIMSGTLISSGKTACVAAVNGADTWENGNLSYKVLGQKMMFLMNK